MDGEYCLACVLFGHEFVKDSKKMLLRTDPSKLSPSEVSDFKRHVEGKRKKKVSARNRTLHKDTSALFYSVEEKMERNLEGADDILDRQFKFEVSQTRKILRSIIDTIILLERQDIALRGRRDDSLYHPHVGEYSTRSVGNSIVL